MVEATCKTATYYPEGSALSFLDPFIDGLRKEARTIPWTVISLVSLWLVAWAAAAAYVTEIRPAQEVVANTAAKAQQVAIEVSSKVTRIEAALLEERIFETKVKQCGAESEEARRFFQQRVQEMLSEYQRLTMQVYPLPACESVR